MTAGSAVRYRVNAAAGTVTIGTAGTGTIHVSVIRYNSTSSADAYLNTGSATNFDPDDTYQSGVARCCSVPARRLVLLPAISIWPKSSSTTRRFKLEVDAPPRRIVRPGAAIQRRADDDVGGAGVEQLARPRRRAHAAADPARQRRGDVAHQRVVVAQRHRRIEVDQLDHREAAEAVNPAVHVGGFQGQRLALDELDDPPALEIDRRNQHDARLSRVPESPVPGPRAFTIARPVPSPTPPASPGRSPHPA